MFAGCQDCRRFSVQLLKCIKVFSFYGDTQTSLAWAHFRSSAFRVQDAFLQCLERGEEVQAMLTRSAGSNGSL